MTDTFDQKPASTELTGGAGFMYEDTVVAYYLAHLLRHERAASQTGIVTSVAVQRQGHGHPMDDVIVGLDDAGTKSRLIFKSNALSRLAALTSNSRKSSRPP